MATVKEYSVEEKLTSVLRLQKIDSKLDEIQVLKGELPMEVKDLEDEIEGLNTRLTNIEDEIRGIQEFINNKKNAIKDSEALIQKYEKQQNNVKNSREFEAISKEIEMQTLEVKLSEKHIRDAGNEISEKERILEGAKQTIADKEANLQHKKAELEKIIAETEKEEQQYHKQSEEARSKVEPRLLTAYEKIRKTYRNGLAVVPIERDSCGGCFNAIPPQRQAEIRQRKKVIVCEHCGRILVDDELNETIVAK
ncbi:zinc ribbon domain-containing protein [Compostibacter hankyongensis]|uniref:C4-type zinc ribbon domain-containing protein n=1 Tax=Compostibacter hankyongensis TaxID=1007089 RepID=A0ABP8FY78_9BACT